MMVSFEVSALRTIFTPITSPLTIWDLIALGGGMMFLFYAFLLSMNSCVSNSLKEGT